MEDLNRRDAVKFAAAAGLVAVGGGVASASSGQRQDQPAQGEEPANWGKEGDQTFKVENAVQYSGDENSLLGNNCGEKMRDLLGRFDCVEFGGCSYPTPVEADVVAAGLMVKVAASGCVVNTEFGHKTVKNRVAGITFNTYLAYAAGDRP